MNVLGVSSILYRAQANCRLDQAEGAGATL